MKRTKKTPTKTPEPKPWYYGMKFFKGLSFGDGSAYVDAARRLRDQKLRERGEPIPPKPN